MNQHHDPPRTKARYSNRCPLCTSWIVRDRSWIVPLPEPLYTRYPRNEFDHDEASQWAHAKCWARLARVRAVTDQLAVDDLPDPWCQGVTYGRDGVDSTLCPWCLTVAAVTSWTAHATDTPDNYYCNNPDCQVRIYRLDTHTYPDGSVVYTAYSANSEWPMPVEQHTSTEARRLFAEAKQLDRRPGRVLRDG